MSLEAIRTKAIHRGLVSDEAATKLSDQEIIDFIFQPGFSTANIITDLSGRGVGLDVVKQIIVEELKGNITVDTQPNRGTRFMLRLPMSLAIMRILLIQHRQISFGLTTQYVTEILRIPRQQLMSVADRQTVLIRNEFIPVVALHDIVPQQPAGGQAQQEEDLLLIVLRVNTEKLAIAVDRMLDEGEFIIKPLPKHLQHNLLISGMIAHGDNQLISILHAPALFNLARRYHQQTPYPQPNNTANTNDSHVKHILVVDDSFNTREIEKDILEAHGYTVTLAEDGLDGLNKARAGDFDAILTDVEMPNMDGFTLIAHLRQEDKYRHRPIILITSCEKEEDKRRGVQAGADAYIVKGDFEQNSLIETLHALLS